MHRNQILYYQAKSFCFESGSLFSSAHLPLNSLHGPIGLSLWSSCLSSLNNWDYRCRPSSSRAWIMCYFCWVKISVCMPIPTFFGLLCVHQLKLNPQSNYCLAMATYSVQELHMFYHKPNLILLGLNFVTYY